MQYFEKEKTEPDKFSSVQLYLIPKYSGLNNHFGRRDFLGQQCYSCPRNWRVGSDSIESITWFKPKSYLIKPYPFGTRKGFGL